MVEDVAQFGDGGAGAVVAVDGLGEVLVAEHYGDGGGTLVGVLVEVALAHGAVAEVGGRLGGQLFGIVGALLSFLVL